MGHTVHGIVLPDAALLYTCVLINPDRGAFKSPGGQAHPAGYKQQKPRDPVLDKVAGLNLHGEGRIRTSMLF